MSICVGLSHLYSHLLPTLYLLPPPVSPALILLNTYLPSPACLSHLHSLLPLPREQHIRGTAPGVSVWNDSHLRTAASPAAALCGTASSCGWEDACAGSSEHLDRTTRGGCFVTFFCTIVQDLTTKHIPSLQAGLGIYLGLLSYALLFHSHLQIWGVYLLCTAGSWYIISVVYGVTVVYKPSALYGSRRRTSLDGSCSSSSLPGMCRIRLPCDTHYPPSPYLATPPPHRRRAGDGPPARWRTASTDKRNTTLATGGPLVAVILAGLNGLPSAFTPWPAHYLHCYCLHSAGISRLWLARHYNTARVDDSLKTSNCAVPLSHTTYIPGTYPFTYVDFSGTSWWPVLHNKQTGRAQRISSRAPAHISAAPAGTAHARTRALIPPHRHAPPAHLLLALAGMTLAGRVYLRSTPLR